jgi:hypothetical protein
MCHESTDYTAEKHCSNESNKNYAPPPESPTDIQVVVETAGGLVEGGTTRRRKSGS